VKFNDTSFLEKLINTITPEDRLLAEPWIKQFLEGQIIPANYEGYAMLTPKRNIHIDEFKRCFSF
jgi:hypothetical protein